MHNAWLALSRGSDTLSGKCIILRVGLGTSKATYTYTTQDGGYLIAKRSKATCIYWQYAENVIDNIVFSERFTMHNAWLLSRGSDTLSGKCIILRVGLETFKAILHIYN